MPAMFLVAVALFVEKDGKILLAKRSEDRDSGAGIWEVPSGRLEARELPEDAVRREGMEELGVEVKPVRAFHAAGFRRIDKDLIILSYQCSISGTPSMSSEHSEFRWMDPNEAVDFLKHKNQKEAVHAYLRLRDNKSSSLVQE